MQKFDCLSLECPLWGPHLLEASAGTGKTFSIEHIFVRLILEGIEVEEILALTFTRAATRELKARIRANLEKALSDWEKGSSDWEYLQARLGSEADKKLLSDALSGFDRCQIFTIHGFCHRMLQEFAFEAQAGNLRSPDEPVSIPESLESAVYDFLEHGISEEWLCREQIAALLQDFDSLEQMAERLLSGEEKKAGLCFSELKQACKTVLHAWTGERLSEEKLLADFALLVNNYKATLKGDFRRQVQGLFAEAHFPCLIREKGSVFSFLRPENRKVKAKDPSNLHYPGFFDWAREHLFPLFQQKSFPLLQKAWKPIQEQVIAREEPFLPDEILLKMKRALENPEVAQKIRKKYRAAIIDEFQDTDEVQWEIFQTLFLEEPLQAVYLVGDPKQSIYRFRKADIYTYLKARDVLGEPHLYQLTTNFRSSKSLIGALNALFSRNWLHLPKTKSVLPYSPVEAGSSIESSFPDEKGAVHFLVAEGEPRALFEEVFLPYAVREIESLSLKKVALLVKDRYQAAQALALFQKRKIPAVAKSHIPLGQSDAFKALFELFEAVMSPHKSHCAERVRLGPFAGTEMPFEEWKTLLEEQGLVPFAQQLCLDEESLQIFERLFAWEKSEGFSFEGLKRFLKRFQEMKAEEGAARRMEVNEEAVQIMTLHISKGLEFDVVFALGLASRTPGSEEIEELNAEKLRQLYVAMTRAKKRLYLPVALSEKEIEEGTHSPLELFAKHFSEGFLREVEKIGEKESVSVEKIGSPIFLGPVQSRENPKKAHSPPPIPRPYTPSYLSSFTLLAKPQLTETKSSPSNPHLFTLQTMPRGAETGIEIHTLFEKLFGEKTPIWREPSRIRPLVEEHLRFSLLAPWKEAIVEMVEKTLVMPLEVDGEFFTLSEIDSFEVEVEFLFSAPPHFIKGFIDLLFVRNQKVYFVDWKTNWLEEYTPSSLKKAIEAHDYGLQVQIYQEAIRRHFPHPFGGAFYLFLRGGQYVALGL